MIQKELIEAISKTKNSKIENLTINHFDATGLVPAAEVHIEFENRIFLQFSFWRIIERVGTLSFLDHNQKYGGKSSINAYEYLSSKILKEVIMDAVIDPETGDIILKFKDARLQILKMNGYENWTLGLPDGSVEYSNYIETELKE